MDINIDYQHVIEELASQVARLTTDNAVLRAALRSVEAEHQDLKEDPSDGVV